MIEKVDIIIRYYAISPIMKDSISLEYCILLHTTEVFAALLSLHKYYFKSNKLTLIISQTVLMICL